MKSQMLRLGARLPAFHKLRSVDGKSYSSDDFNSNTLVIVFSCNHCPFVQAYEDRMKTLQKDYGFKGVQLVAINSNDDQNYPEDSFDKMVTRAEKQGLDFPYLRDEDQTVAGKFGATHTPQFFVFDKERTLRYLGKMDDNWKEPQLVKDTYLRDALDAIIADENVKVPETFSIGCTIKWR